MIEKTQKQWPERKSEKEGLFRRWWGAWCGWMGFSATDAPSGGGMCPKSVSRVAIRWRVNFNVRLEIGAWEGIFRRGFHRKVDRREVLLLVCSSTIMEVAGKSRS